MQNRRTLHLIALFEAAKGLAALAALIGVLDLMHHDVRRIAMDLIGRSGLDPAAHYPSMLLHYADLLPSASVPFEVSHLVHRPGWSGWLVVAGNLALVVYLVVLLRRRLLVKSSRVPG